MQLNIFGTPEELAEFIFNLQDISIEADDVHEDVHEDEKEISDKEKFEAELYDVIKKYPQFEVEFKAGTLTIDSSE